MPELPAINETPSAETRHQLDALVAQLPATERIPRRSGDMAFDHTWEIRAFAIATAMHQAGAFDWSEFQQRLIDSIGQWEREDGDTANWRYYHHWMDALEDLVRTKGLVDDTDLDARTQHILDNPAANHHGAVREPICVIPATPAVDARH